MTRAPSIDQFALYGEENGRIPPEFIHIETISQRSRIYDWTIAPHAHPGIFQVLLLQAGTGVLATDVTEASLVKGALAILPAGCVHAFRFSPDAEGAVLSIALNLLNDPRIALLCANAMQLARSPRVAQLETGSLSHAQISWLMNDIFSLLILGRAGTLSNSAAARIALLITLADEACSTQSGGVPLHRQNARDRLGARFRDMVELHFRDGWSISDYATALGATRPTLNRSCRAVLGKAPAEIVHDRILLEAMRSLTYATASVSQIAADLGFTEPGYFARFFRQRAGMTASEFRRSRSWLQLGRKGAVSE